MLRNNIFLLFILQLAFLLPATAQKVDLSQFKGINVRNIGPAGMSGRVTAIDVDLSDSDRIFIGTASGGVWLSENGGISWKPIFDDQDNLSIGALKINQNNPAEIWVGTGEGNPRNSHNSGKGVYKSIDGGKTWKHMGLEKTKLIHRIIIHRDDPNVVFVGAMGTAWAPTEDRGVYKTTDGGETWEKALYVNEKVGVADMVVDPSNPNKIIAAMWEFGREPWFFNSGGPGSGLYITYDAGKNWTEVTEKDGLPKGDLGRIGLAFAPSKPNIVYALVEAKVNGLYKSVDGGKKWTLVSEKNIGDRPFYYAELYVDPKNENRIFNIYTYVSKSEDGGKTFESVADYGNNVHPDHHAFWIHPEDPSYIIDGNDGGLAISRDGSATWQFAANIPVGQFYHVNVDDDFPYNVYGGMQDNGSWGGPSFVLKSGGIRNHDWQELFFGDGFDVAPKPGDSRYGYAMSQGGNIGYYDRKTGRTAFIKPVHPENVFLRYNWNSALALEPGTDCGLYFGSQFVHYSSDCGKSWTIISPDLTTNDPEKQKQLESGGLTYDATQAENYTTIIAIAPSPVDENLIWVGTDDGNVQLTRDKGQTWTNLSPSIPGFPQGGFIPKIEVSNKNAGEAFVVVNDYRRNDWSAYLFHTKDYGATWERIVDDADAGAFVCAVVQDDEQENLLFLGTDDGLYVSFDYGKVWNKWTEGFPSVQIRDFAIQNRDADLVIATFGRAFWVMDDIRPLRAIAATNAEILKKELAIFDPPTAYQTSNRSYDGIRFTGQGEFIGDNRGAGVRVKVWFKEHKEEKKEKADKPQMEENKDKKEAKSKGKEEVVKAEENKEGTMEKEAVKESVKRPKEATMIVLDMKGDTLRTIERKLEEGFNTLYWGMDKTGVRTPSLREPRGNFQPGGADVLPGIYKIVVEFGDLKDSTEIVVASDPRIEVNISDLEKKDAMIKDYQAVIKASTEAFNQLKTAKEKVEMAGKMAELLPDSTKKELVELNKATIKVIDSLMNVYLEIEEPKGIKRDPGKLNNTLGSAGRYLSSSWGVPGDNAMAIVNIATEEAQKSIDNINSFINNEWSDYMNKVKAMEFDLFNKELKTVKIE